MRSNIHARCLVLTAILAAGAVFTSCVADSETSVCEGSGTGTPVATIVHGAGFCEDAGDSACVTGREGVDEEVVTGSRIFYGTLSSSVFVAGLTVGGVPVTSSDGNFATWSATLTQADLEANRAEGGEIAKIEVAVISGCDGGTVPLVYTDVRLAADPSNSNAPPLSLTVTINNPHDVSDCYLPATGGAAATVTATGTDAYFTSSTVALAANAGTFAPASAVFTDDGAGEPTAASYFSYVPTSTSFAPIVTLSASSEGAVSEPYPIVVAAAPSTTPAMMLVVAPGTYETVYVTTRGRLAGCYYDYYESSPVPDGGVDGGDSGADGGLDAGWVAPNPNHFSASPAPSSPSSVPTISVGASTEPASTACQGTPDAFAKKAATQDLWLNVAFDAMTPPTAVVVLHCLDTFGQDASVTITAQ